jgi:hypothetical protein
VQLNVGGEALVGQLAFSLVQLASLEGVVWEVEEGNACYTDEKSALVDEEPRFDKSVMWSGQGER